MRGHRRLWAPRPSPSLLLTKSQAARKAADEAVITSAESGTRILSCTPAEQTPLHPLQMGTQARQDSPWQGLPLSHTSTLSAAIVQCDGTDGTEREQVFLACSPLDQRLTVEP
jgi:hypothetical protein